MKKMHQLKKYDEIQELPATMEQRSCTDVLCICVGVAFTVIMLIMATASFNKANYLKSNFPADTDGSLCGFDLPQYQYLYFADLPQINHRICVQQCPKKGDKTLKCSPTDEIGCKISEKQRFSAKFYESQPQKTRGGFFCWPTSTELQQQIYNRSNLKQRNQIYNSLDTIKYSLALAVVLSLVYFVLVQLIPLIMNFVVVALGMAMLLIIVICVFTYDTDLVKFKIFIAIFMLVLFVFFALTIYKHFASLYLHSIYLKWSTVMCANRKMSIFYIPIFICIVVGFTAIMIWEFTGFWTAGSINYDPNYQIYHELSGAYPTVMSFFMVIQLIWGLSFIKEAFNFCVSGNAVHWFLQEQIRQNSSKVQLNVFYPVLLLVKKHIGTVIAGAFMTGFFVTFDAIFDFLRPTSNQGTFYNKCFAKACCCCNQLFDFVRSDALAYVNLAGNPYCNSSRYCEMLCRKSVTVEYAQSSSRIYRLCAHLLIMGIVGILALYINGNISLYAQLLILVGTIFISTMFISYHADSAEAIQISLLTIEQLHFAKQNSSGNNQDLSELKQYHIRQDLIEQIALERKKRN